MSLRWSLLSLLLMLSACYYDNEQELYPCDYDPSQCEGLIDPCDTENVGYASFVQPLLAQHCIVCHQGAAASANIRLDSYAAVKTYVDNGRLFGAMNHEPGYEAMPQGGNKLPDCDLAKLKAWIDAGAVDN
ncbi:MAG: cytochrome c [Bacteroidetes bacterium]|nr:MAG: cytochrome c [Bacteroidota bacterium]